MTALSVCGSALVDRRSHRGRLGARLQRRERAGIDYATIVRHAPTERVDPARLPLPRMVDPLLGEITGPDIPVMRIGLAALTSEVVHLRAAAPAGTDRILTPAEPERQDDRDQYEEYAHFGR